MTNEIFKKEALDFHIGGKIAIKSKKNLASQADLALAYSPGVGYPCLEIEKDPEAFYKYTSPIVAVVTNGTAVLGLGNLGAKAATPVMEGKSVLFKRFADIDSYPIQINAPTTEEFIKAISYIADNTWAGINLEDIKAPECFIIEEELKNKLDIPVFHDDQHGTAVIALAGLLNACELTNRKFEDLKIVVSGAGAAAISCINLMKKMGVKHENVIMCDTKGVIYKGRTDNMNKWKEEHAVETDLRQLSEAMIGADAFFGLSVKGMVTKDMILKMNQDPIIFAMANPDPEITPEEVYEVRKDAIVATGRSDYPNQINNVMGFPYIFRGAIDVRAKKINDEMKIAAAYALSELAKEHVPDEVTKAYSGRNMSYGRDYIIPVPFDNRLISRVSMAVAKAAMDTGVARKPIENWDTYEKELSNRLDCTVNIMSMALDNVKSNPKRVIFAEGEEDQIIKSAIVWYENGYGTPILIGREEVILEKMKKIGLKDPTKIIIHNAALEPDLEEYVDFLYKKLHRKGYLKRDCSRLVKHDRNIFAACMLEYNKADILLTGVTRTYNDVLDSLKNVLNMNINNLLFSISILVKNGHPIYIGDTMVHEYPTPFELVQMAVEIASKARKMGQIPRVAFISFSNFGNPMHSEKALRMRQAVEILDNMNVDFEYDGEMSPDVALSKNMMELYPFCRLTDTANILIMPGLHSANISSKLLSEFSDTKMIDPVLIGFNKPVQILKMNSTINEIINIATLAAVDLI